MRVGSRYVGFTPNFGGGATREVGKNQDYFNMGS